MGSTTKNFRGKPCCDCALILSLAFGVAILGVIVLHKLREKHIFTLLVKTKDHDLLTLHLLLQKEQELNKEARKKIQEMKAKVYSLRSQKLEVDRRVLDMESTIASLKDERVVLESTVASLMDIIKTKESEIGGFKQKQNSTMGEHAMNETALYKQEGKDDKNVTISIKIDEKSGAGINNGTAIRVRKRRLRGQRSRNVRSRRIGELGIPNENVDHIKVVSEQLSSDLNQTRTPEDESEKGKVGLDEESVKKASFDRVEIRDEEDANKEKMEKLDVIEYNHEKEQGKEIGIDEGGGDGEEPEEGARGREMDRADIERFAESEREEEEEEEPEF